MGEDSSLGYTRRNVDSEGPVVLQKRFGSNNPTTPDVSPDPAMA